jgi:D-glycero-beta-D-manno-heptose-7-phosphate kinase
MIDPKERDLLLRTIDQFSRARVLVLGDFVADEYVDGEISRVSREAPVLILKHRHTEIVPGGGANAANNLVDLGAKVFPFSIVGRDVQGSQLIQSFRRKRVSAAGILIDRSFSTTTKSRILAGSAHTTHQQVVRIDRQASVPPDERVRERLIEKASRIAPKVDAILVSDYGSGMISSESLDTLRTAIRKRPIPLNVDSRYQILRFKSFTAATPNEPEVEAALGMVIGNNPSALEGAGRRLLKRLRTKALLITRGKEGMALFEPGRATKHLPIYGTDQVADVTGAGDTVIAVFTLALACGASFLQAARLSNYAGGVVVMKHGTATVRREELMAAVESDVM